MTPLPQSFQSDCAEAYGRAADSYWPVVGDILRFNAMFENYVTLCGKEDPAQIKAIRPFVDRMKAQASQDVDDAYGVMIRLIHTRLAPNVPPACRTDRKAQDRATDRFVDAMDDQARKARARLARSARDMGGGNGEVCHNLTAIRDDIEKHTAGKNTANPLYQLAFMRGLAANPGNAKLAGLYLTYRSVLQEVQAKRKSKN